VTRFLAACLAAALAFAGVAAANRADLPRPDQQWIELRTRNFTLVSHAGERATRRIAADLEELRGVLARFTSLQLSSPVPTLIFVFRDDREFDRFSLRFQGQPTAASGYFMRRSDGNYIAINGNSRRDASEIVYHEYVHYFASTNLPGLPLWFEEGLSELYASFRVTGRKAQLGFPDPVHYFLLNTQPLIPLPELLAADHSSPLYQDPDRKGMFYAESWALVHYLLVGSDLRRPEALRFVALVTTGVPQQEALAAAFSTDLAGLEAELDEYVGRRIFRYVESVASDRVDQPISVRSMPYADLLYRLGDLLSQHDPPRPEAEQYLLAAVATEPDHGPALASLGVLAADRADWPQAERYFARALAAGPDDATVQYLGGSFLLDRGDDVERATASLRRASELDPEFAPAWAELAAAHVASGLLDDEAIRAAENAHRLLPSHHEITQSLLRLYLATGRRGAAVELLATDFTGTARDRADARSAVVQHDIGRALERLAQGNADAAEQALADGEALFAGDASDPWLAGQISSVRGQILERRLSDRYREAQLAYHRGDLETARAILVELVRLAPEGRQAETVQALLALIDHPERAEPQRADPGPATGIGPQDIERFNALAAQGDLAGARSALDRLRPHANPDEFEWIDQRIGEIDAVIAYNRFVDQYNRAVRQFNAGAYGNAVATLERLLEDQPVSPAADDARALLEEATAALTAPQ
jgi:tetratricopeptide (TPR) repeat protein